MPIAEEYKLAPPSFLFLSWNSAFLSKCGINAWGTGVTVVSPCRVITYFTLIYFPFESIVFQNSLLNFSSVQELYCFLKHIPLHLFLINRLLQDLFSFSVTVSPYCLLAAVKHGSEAEWDMLMSAGMGGTPLNSPGLALQPVPTYFS